MSIDQKTLEGIVNAGTSTATKEEEGEAAPELNNSTVPTEEEQKAAGIAPEAAPEAQPVPEANETNALNETNPDSSENTDVASTESEVDPEGVSEAEATKSFTQSQVDEIAGKVRKETREKVYKDIFSRYGVNSADELDELFGDAQRYGIARDEFTEKETAWKQADEARSQELTSVKERVALLESGIDQNRFEDARLILRGKGLEVTAENIAAELATHPEWKAQPNPIKESGLPFIKNPNPAPAPAPTGPATKIAIPTLGNNSQDTPNPEISEREKAMSMFFRK